MYSLQQVYNRWHTIIEWTGKPTCHALTTVEITVDVATFPAPVDGHGPKARTPSPETTPTRTHPGWQLSHPKTFRPTHPCNEDRERAATATRRNR